MDDNSVGETISSSTGTPTVTYYGYGTGLSYSPTSGDLLNLHDVRFSYFTGGISISLAGSSGHVIRNAQFYDCLSAVGSHNVYYCLRNVLVSVGQYVDGSSSSQVSCENVTVHNVGILSQYNSPCALTNCLIVGVSTNQANLSVYDTRFLTNDAGVFQLIEGGAHYLAASSPYRNAGTTNIDVTLLADLRNRTTYAPQVYANQTISTNLTLTPHVSRDTGAAPDLGYHYDALDYIVSNVNLSATLTLTNGVAVGVVVGGGYGCAVYPQTGANIMSWGSLLSMNRIVSCQNVQELPISAAGNQFILLNGSAGGSPSFQFRFTDFSLGQGGLLGDILVSGSGMGAFSAISFQDCWLRGAWLEGNAMPYGMNETIGLTNNLIFRSAVGFTYNGGYANSVTFNCYNNLFLGGSFFATMQSGSQTVPAWNVKDNLFDGATQYTYSDSGGAAQMYFSNNGFTLGTANYLGGNNNLFDFTPDYQAGPLGNYYYPNSGGNLSQLIDAGSRTADLAGLYHYTVQTNELKETNSIVDIGYHYVAVDANGNPVDSNGDGIPDYIQDANGNGVVDNGETNWSMNILIQPVNQSVVLGASASFQVTVGGIAPFSYQWWYNGTNFLLGATNAFLNLSSVQITNLGNYSVTISNFTGSITSSLATLSVSCEPAPAGLIGWWPAEGNPFDVISGNNGTLTNGVTFSNGMAGQAFNFSGPNSGMSATINGLPAGNAPHTIEAWVYTMAYPPSQAVSIVLLLGGPNQGAHSWSLGSDGNMGLGVWGGVKSFFPLPLGQWMHVAVTSDGTNMCCYTNGVLLSTQLESLGGVPFNFSDNSFSLSVPVYSYFTNYNGLMDEVSIYNRALSANEISTIYNVGKLGNAGKCFTPPTIIQQPTNQVVLPGSPATFRVQAVGDLPLVYQWWFNGAMLAGTTNTTLTLTNVQAANVGAYMVVVANDGGSTSSATAQLIIPPFITTQPTNQTIVQGNSALFTVTAGGGTFLNYQWYLNATNPIPGATNNYLWFSNVQTTNAGNYSVVVTNVAGSVTSSNALLTVLVPAFISTQPTNLTVVQGYNLTNSVVAGGTAPLSCKWWYNGTNLLAGATNSTLVITNAQTTNSGIYSVVISNLVNSVTSSNVQITVLVLPPAIVSQPTNLAVVQGDNPAFSVVATGSFPLSYQWWFNGTNLIAGATNANLMLTNIQPTNAGNYSVSITNIAGSLTSSNAVLTVGLAVRLGYWRFDNSNTWVGEAGQLPLLTNWLTAVSSWSTNAVQVDNTNGARLVYRSVETNGNVNISCQKGTIRFWFKPDWASTNAGGSGLSGAGRLIELGNQTTTNGWWALAFNPGGTQLTFGTQTNGVGMTNLVAPIAWTSNFWHQIALTYSASGSTLYLDGVAVTNGSGPVYYPNAGEQTNGFKIGSDSNGTNQAQGAFDEMETFNYQLSASAIATNYQTLISQDSNGDGMADIWEMNYFGTLNVNPNGNPAGDGLTNLQKYQAGLNPNVDASTLPGQRANYIYTPADWLNTVSGVKTGLISTDNEGNVGTVSQ